MRSHPLGLGRPPPLADPWHRKGTFTDAQSDRARFDGDPGLPGPSPSPAADGADHGALIVAIARSGDRAAFATLFTHYAPRLKSYLRRLGANDASAEEVAQEALLMVWRKAERFDPTKAGAATWIFTIARNLRIDMLRKERRPEIDPEDPLLEPSSPDAADILIEKDQRETRVRTALRSLPADQAEVVRLAFSKI